MMSYRSINEGKFDDVINVTEFKARQSQQKRLLPYFLVNKTTDANQSVSLGSIKPASRSCFVCREISSLSAGECRYARELTGGWSPVSI
jgi:hypothetical protein